MDQNVNDKKLNDFFESGKRLTYKKGETILRPDDNVNGVYLVKKGFVRVYWLSVSGDEKQHVIYKQGEIFPLMWALNDVEVGGYYEAMEETVCQRVGKNEFIDFLKSNSEVLFALTSKLADIFNIYVNRVDNLVITKAYPRLISQLIFLASRFGRETGEGVLLDIPITETDIARSIALTRETVNRVLHQAENRNLIGRANQRILIYDIEKLKEELEKNYEKIPL